jgi:UDP-glucose 4-epimerase
MRLGDKKFVVFGGAGFIGSHVVHLLAQEPVKEIVVFDQIIKAEKLEGALATGKVKLLQGSIVEPREVEAVMSGVDGVFHLAALPIIPSIKAPRSCVDVNILGTFNIIEAAQKAGVKKIVFSSASSVYGDTDQIMDESHPLNARTMYGAGKIAGEFFLRAFHEMYKLDYVILRYMNVYGPRQEGGLVMSVLNRIKQNQPPVIHGDGKQSFDFVDVTDIARANLLAMQSDVTDQAFNVGSGTEASVKEIVELLLELIGSNMHPVYEPAGQVLMFRRVGSNEKARKLLGFQAQVSLREGLRRVIKNYKASSN